MKWRPGRKVTFYTHGMLLKPRAQERAEKELALNRAALEQTEKELERAEKELALNRLELERAEKERLLELLFKAGIDPNAP